MSREKTSPTALSISRALLGLGKTARCYLTGEELPVYKDVSFTTPFHIHSSGHYYRYYGFLYLLVLDPAGGAFVNVYRNREDKRVLVGRIDKPTEIKLFHAN